MVVILSLNHFSHTVWRLRFRRGVVINFKSAQKLSPPFANKFLTGNNWYFSCFISQLQFRSNWPFFKCSIWRKRREKTPFFSWNIFKTPFKLSPEYLHFLWKRIWKILECGFLETSQRLSQQCKRSQKAGSINKFKILFENVPEKWLVL